MYVLWILILFAALGSVAMQWNQILHRDQLRQRGLIQARAAAAAGMAKARRELRADMGWKGGTYQLGQCRVQVAVEPGEDGGATLHVVADAFPGGELGPRVRVVLPDPRVGVRQMSLRSRPPR